MGIHRIQGPTVRAALREVERALGPGALIVETRAVAGGFEVAAVPGPSRRPPPDGGFCPAFRGLAARGRAFGLPDALLRRVDRAVRAAGLAGADPEAPAVLRSGAEALAGLLPTARLGADARATAFVGRAGVGRTATIAKLAARAARNGRPIALASLDVARPAASAALEDLAATLGLTFVRLRDGAALGSLLDADPTAPHLLVDTPPASPRDPPSIDGLGAALADPRVRSLLCVPAGARAGDAELLVESFGRLGPRAAVLTRWDETGRPGEILGLLAARGLPLAFIGTGPRIPGDLVDADAEVLAACALGLDEELAQRVLGP
jgi:flagellar biosynthesis protein FlhF